MDRGNQLIVYGDFNSEYAKLSEWFINEGLRDLMEQRYGKCPIIYQKSKQDPIDYIFGSPSMEIIKVDALHLTT